MRTLRRETFGTLKRYDVLTGQKVEIMKPAHTSIVSAQLSANGEWLLFVTGQGKLQLVRMDGQDLQTIYCNPTGINHVQWSTDLQHIVFDFVTTNGIAYLDLLTTNNGALQTELLGTERKGPFSFLNFFSQFPWSNVSRNGSQYVLQVLNVNNPNNLTYTLEYGSLKGGAPVVFASITNVQLETVGWTTM